MTQSSSTPAAKQSALKRFLASEAAGGVLIAATAAVLVANSPLADAYHHALHEVSGPILSQKLEPPRLPYP